MLTFPLSRLETLGRERLKETFSFFLKQTINFPRESYFVFLVFILLYILCLIL